MGKTEISELERLADSVELVAPIEYDNPRRVDDIFFQFVKDYSDLVDIPITERKVGFIYDKKVQFNNTVAAITNSELPMSERLVYGLLNGLVLVFPPIFYPIYGASASITNFGDSIRVNLPKYSGVLGFLSFKPHEYMHAYHILAAKDLRDKGLLPNIYGDDDVGLMEPQYRVPTKVELKKFERRFLRAMIKQETKYL